MACNCEGGFLRVGLRDILISTCVLAGLSAGTLVLAIGTARPHADRLAVIFPPWWTPAQVFAAAASAGRLVAPGHLPGTVIVQGDAAILADRLRAAGALLVLDSSLSAGCQAVAPEIAR